MKKQFCGLCIEGSLCIKIANISYFVFNFCGFCTFVTCLFRVPFVSRLVMSCILFSISLAFVFSEAVVNRPVMLQSRAKYLEQRKKSSKIRQDYKTLTSTFAYFLNAIAKFKISVRENGDQAKCPPRFETFLVIPNFLKS